MFVDMYFIICIFQYVSVRNLSLDFLNSYNLLELFSVDSNKMQTRISSAWIDLDFLFSCGHRDRLEQMERQRERDRKIREQQKEQREFKDRERRAEERRKEREARRDGQCPAEQQAYTHTATLCLCKYVVPEQTR